MPKSMMTLSSKPEDWKNLTLDWEERQSITIAKSQKAAGQFAAEKYELANG